MARIVLIGSFADSLINFRGSLLRHFVRLGHEVFACAPFASENVKRKLNRFGVSYRHILIDRTGLNLVTDMRTLVQCYRLFRSVKPDLILSYTMKPVVYASLAGVAAGVPERCAMITGLGRVFSGQSEGQGKVATVVRVLLRAALAFNRVVFFQNPDDRRFFRKQGILRRRSRAVLINGSGVDLQHYAQAPPPKDVSFLLIARLIGEKGIREYAEAARIVKSRYPEVVFRLVGWIDKGPSGIRRNELYNWVEQGVIAYLGRLEDVRPCLRESSVFVLPSIYGEGTPRTVLEAMATGRPIITTDAPGCRETVIEGVNGFLIPTKNVHALARAMMRFVEEPEMLSRMGRESRRLAEQKFDVRLVNATIMKSLELC